MCESLGLRRVGPSLMCGAVVVEVVVKLGPAYKDGDKWYRPIEFESGDVIPEGAESSFPWSKSDNVGRVPYKELKYRLPMEYWPEIKVGDWFVCDRRWFCDEFGFACPVEVTIGVPMLCEDVSVYPRSKYYYPKELCLKVDPPQPIQSQQLSQSGTVDGSTPKLMAWVPRLEKWEPPRKLLYRKVVEKGEAIQEGDEWGDGRKLGAGNTGSIKESSQSFICRPVYADPEPVTFENLPDGRVVLSEREFFWWGKDGCLLCVNSRGCVMTSSNEPEEFTVTDYVVELRGAE